MATKEKTQLQVRIDSKTKNAARRVLDDIGMDASTAVNILFKQIARTKAFPIDLRDVNGFRPHKARELREAVFDARRSKESFSNVGDLLKDVEA